MNELLVQGAGYIASVLLAISLLVNNDLKFRWLNTAGCFCFIVYGIVIHAFPIILTNSILLLINGFYLVRIYRAHEDFDLIEFKGDEQLVNKFQSFYAKGIKEYFPGYNKEEAANIRFVVLRDLVIANIFIADLQDDGTAVVKLNYTVPKYRDYKVGKFIFEKENKYLLSKGVHRILYKHAIHKNHESFLKVMGFKKELVDGHDLYVKRLS